MNSATTGLTTQQWFQAAQNAASVKPDDPRYPRAQAVIASARQTILARSAAAHLAAGQPITQGPVQSVGQSFAPPDMTPQTGAVGSFIEHFGHGASLGFSDELGGALTGLLGRRAGETTQQAYERGLKEQRDYLAASSNQHGISSGLGELGGTAATSTLGTAGLIRALPGAAAAFTAAEGVPFAARLAASTALGATTGGTIGAISGAGNADEGSRLLGAGIGGLGGALLGGGTAALGTTLAKGIRMVRTGLQTGTGPSANLMTPPSETVGPQPLANPAEANLRAALAQQGASPAQIEEKIALTKARFGGISSAPRASEVVTRSQTVPEEIGGASETGLGGRPTLETPPGATVQPPPPQVAPTAPQSAPSAMPGAGRPVFRGRPDQMAMWRELMTYPLTPQIQGEMGPALQGMDRQSARALMAQVAQADAFGSIPAPWRDFLLSNLQKAGSLR